MLTIKVRIMQLKVKYMIFFNRPPLRGLKSLEAIILHTGRHYAAIITEICCQNSTPRSEMNI